MIYQFASISLNSESMCLHINGQLIEAEDRLVSLLIELVEHYPQHCDKDLLLEKLWPETVVSDWSVSKLVSDTRHLFKKHGYEHEIIQTVRGRGYRLNAELGEQITVSEQTDLSQPLSVLPTQPKSNSGLLLIAVALVMVLAGVWLWSDSSQQGLVVSEPANSVGRLLWVDDNPDNNTVERQYLEQHNVTVYQVRSTEEALISLELYEYKAVISDMGRDGEVLAGLNLLKTMRAKHNATPFFLYTIVLTDAQHELMEQYHGQGVAVNPEQLYQLILPLYPHQ